MTLTPMQQRINKIFAEEQLEITLKDGRTIVGTIAGNIEYYGMVAIENAGELKFIPIDLISLMEPAKKKVKEA